MPTLLGPGLEPSAPTAGERAVQFFPRWRSVRVVLFQQLLLRLLVLLVIYRARLVRLLEIRQFLSQGRGRGLHLGLSIAAAEAAVLFYREKPLVNN